MFNWLKRKAQLAVINSAEQDIDRFLASLRGASVEELSLIVALATHWRNVFEGDGVELLDPVAAEKKNPSVGMLLNRYIREVQKSNPTHAVGLMVWLHTIRTANIPELRYKGRLMWQELSKGFNGAYEAGEMLMKMTPGFRLQLSLPEQVPVGLEPSS